MTRSVGIALVALAALGLGIALRNTSMPMGGQVWQRQVSPGSLSRAHAWLESNCVACHTPLQSAETVKCVGCHANNGTLLQRQPTAFHASIATCSRCHVEHQGVDAYRTKMDHDVLAEVGLNAIENDGNNASHSRLLAWIRQHALAETAPTHPRVTSREAALNCVTCHGTKDRHQGYFGGDCASCHGTASWVIEEFRHPSPSSVECVQCHQAPPSHRMMHFTMVSRPVAQRAEARVDQCFVCHQTTSWNDIRNVGWYKHH